MAFLSMASAAYACGAISGTFTVTGDNGVSVTSTAVDSSIDPQHGLQTLTGGIAQSCGGDQNSTLSNGHACAIGTAGSIQVTTGASTTGSMYLKPSATAVPAGTCQPLGVAINQCTDAGSPGPLANPTLGPYSVRYLNGPVFMSHTANSWGYAPFALPNCGFYGNGNAAFLSVELGKVTIGTSASDTSGLITGLSSTAFGGSISGNTVTLNLPPSAQNVSPTESGVCIVNRMSSTVNIVPLTIS